MALGKQQIILDASDWVKGMSTSAEVSDGGFSPETDAVNLINTPGVIYAPAAMVDSDTDVRLTGSIIASSTDDDVFLGYERKMVTSDGKYYRYNGTKIPEAALRTDATNTYAKGFTDMISYAGETYVTTKEKLVRWDETGAVFNTAFASFTNTTYPHAALVYENNAYYADGNLLLRQTSAGGAPSTILTLSTDQIIVALGIDEGTGLMVISTTNALNISATLSPIAKLLYYDGGSPKVTKAVIIDEHILGFHSVGGTTYCGYGQNIGYLNGSGVTFLRKLKNVTLNNAELPYKHNLTSINNTLYVADGKQILAFGEVLRGNKVFYYCLSNQVNSNKFTSIFPVGSGKLGMGFATAKFYTFDTTSVATSGTTTWISNKITFPRPVFLRTAYIEYVDAIGVNDDNRSLSVQSQDKDTGYVLLYSKGNTTGSGLKNLSSHSEYFIDDITGFDPDKYRSAQFRYIASAVNYGLKRIIITYDVAE